MNENAPRSVCLAILMIASIALPLLDAQTEPPELRDSEEKMETPPSPCQGWDACRGTDAGTTYSTAMDLSSDFDWNGVNETNVYYGAEAACLAYSYSSADCNDQYIIDPPPGYGVTATLSWNHSNPGTYIQGDTYAFILYFGGEAMTSRLYSTTGSAWCYSYYSNYGGPVSMSTLNGNNNGANAPPYTYCAPAGNTFYPHAVSFPHDLAGEPVQIGVNCYRCYMNTYDDYELEISVWPGDAGQPGDSTSDQTAVILDLPDSPSSWSYQSGTFELDGSNTVNVDVTFCDVWCNPETSVEVTEPDGTSTTWNLADFYVGTLASYSAAGEYLVEKYDTFGDGGMGLTVGSVIGTYTGTLTGNAFDTEVLKSGIVGTTHTSDEWV